jgi:hypothetical protein
VGVDVVADGELTSRDHALGLEPDVEQDLVLVDLDHRAGDDVAVVEVDDGAVDGLLERHPAEVVVDHASEGVLAGLVEGAGLARGDWLRGGRSGGSGLVGHG